MQTDCRNWEEFEGRLLEKYGYKDSLRLSKREFMDWRSSRTLKGDLPDSRHSTGPCSIRAGSYSSSSR